MNESMDVSLQWDRRFRPDMRRLHSTLQRYVDEQCLAYMTLYVPVARSYWHNAGRLRDSGRIEAPGRIVYTAPFARSDYYATKDHAHSGNPAATRLWFETMKTRHARQIAAGAQRLIGGRRWM